MKKMDRNVISMAALGRPFQVGDFYDYPTDCIVSGKLFDLQNEIQLLTDFMLFHRLKTLDRYFRFYSIIFFDCNSQCCFALLMSIVSELQKVQKPGFHLI